MTYIVLNSLTLRAEAVDEESLWATSLHFPLCKIEDRQQAQMLIRGINLHLIPFIVQRCTIQVDDAVTHIVSQFKIIGKDN